VLYMVRRHCGLGVDEFRALRWEEQELLRQGLFEEFNPQRWKEELARMGAHDGDAPLETEVDERQDNSLGALADIMPGVGFTVRQV
jgi:hypothetical protein